MKQRIVRACFHSEQNNRSCSHSTGFPFAPMHLDPRLKHTLQSALSAQKARRVARDKVKKFWTFYNIVLVGIAL